MPAQNPFGRSDLFLYASPVSSSCIGFPLWIPFKCFPTYPFVGLTLTYFVSCIELMMLCLCVSIWVCFYFIFSPPPFGSVTCPEPASLLTNPVTFLWFICFRDSCFFSRAMLLSWLAECKCKITQKNILSVYSQCSCRLVYSDPLLEEIRPHWAWLGSMVISGSHLEMLFTVPCGSITI